MITVVGATGATGRLLVAELLKRGLSVKVFVRAPERLPTELREHKLLTVVARSVLALDPATLASEIEGCSAVACCLGHTLSLRGIYGPPLRLVTNSVRGLCSAVKANAPSEPVRFVLMNTTGNRNRGLNEKRSIAEHCVIGLIRLLLPPYSDNEQAAEYLRSQVGRGDPHIQWAVVRPDSLIDEPSATSYEVVPSPTRSPIFNSGKTSRINVAHFMAELVTDDAQWMKWQGQMPVIYNLTK